ncbi:MAG: hypothetical protein RLZZ272_1181, partial [Actinomycetota bacterium]
ARRLADALELAEHWLDVTELPAPPDGGRTVVLDRAAWTDDALLALRPLVEPIARAAGDALAALAAEQFAELEEAFEERGGIDQELLGGLAAGLSAMLEEGDDSPAASVFQPEVLGIDAEASARLKEEMGAFLRSAAEDPSLLAPMLEGLFGQLDQGDPSELLRPAARMLSGLQAGQVIGRLAREVLGHHDLGIATGTRGTAALVAVNVDEAFSGYGLDATELALVLATTEAAHRRLHHAIAWLDGHVIALVTRFAEASTLTAEDLRELAEELAGGLDLDDPEVLAEAMERAATMRLQPNDAQRHVLAQLQTLVSLVGAWARAEARVALADRLPGLGRIEEVLRRRRATTGDGEDLLAGLLGLDLKPEDESIGERFVAVVRERLGGGGLAGALAHPETLPAPDELADPERWLARLGEPDASDVPDTPSALLEGEAGLGEAPREPSADERRRDGGPDAGGGPDA